MGTTNADTIDMYDRNHGLLFNPGVVALILCVSFAFLASISTLAQTPSQRNGPVERLPPSAVHQRQFIYSARADASSEIPRTTSTICASTSRSSSSGTTTRSGCTRRGATARQRSSSRRPMASRQSSATVRFFARNEEESSTGLLGEGTQTPPLPPDSIPAGGSTR
jgi:hypothetical protein